MSSNSSNKWTAFLWALVGFVIGVVLPSLQQNVGQHYEYHATRLLKEETEAVGQVYEEEEEEENPVLEYTIVVGIVLFLILLTILFEYSKEYLEESSSRNMKPIVESLFGELTVLGFLSIFTFVVTKAGFFMRLGEHLFGPERHEELLEVFESVHYTIFFIMVFFVIQVLILVNEANQTAEEWLEWERAVRNPDVSWSQRAVDYQVHASTTYTVMRWIQSYASIMPCCKNVQMNRQHALLLFKALRDEFVLDRELEYPFSPSQEQVEEDFNFGRYLGACQASMLEKVVHVKIMTWIFFAVGVVVYYLFVLMVHCNREVCNKNTFVCVVEYITMHSLFYVGTIMDMGCFCVVSLSLQYSL